MKVQFHWDREGKNDADSSCWVRVGTLWAGKQLGRDPHPADRPGGHRRLPGGRPRPADHRRQRLQRRQDAAVRRCPANKTQSGVKTRSSLEGRRRANFNEIRFEDKKGAEQVYIHAEKNQDIEVENDETHWVGHDRKKTIDNDETTHVKHDRTETVDNNETITIDGNRTETVDKNETITIDGNRTETVDENETITIDGAAAPRAVGKDETITIDGGRTENGRQGRDDHHRRRPHRDSVGKDENDHDRRRPDRERSPRTRRSRSAAAAPRRSPRTRRSRSTGGADVGRQGSRDHASARTTR